MTLTKRKIMAVLLLAVGGLALATDLLTRRVRGESQSPRTDRYGDDLPSGALARFGTVRFRQGNSIYALDLSPDGRSLLTVGGNNILHLWDVATGKELRHFPEEKRPNTSYAAVFSPDGQTFATGGFFGFSLWQTSTGKRLRYVELGAVYSLAFAPDGKTLAASTLTNGPSLWDVASGKKVAQLTEPGAPRHLPRWTSLAHLCAGWQGVRLDV